MLTKKRIAFSFIFLMVIAFTFTSLIPIPTAKADTGTWTVAVTTDDCIFRDRLSDWFGTGGWLTAGDVSAGYYDYETGIRFQNIAIPQGAIIVSAYINFTAGAIYGNDPTLYVRGQDSDDCITFSNQGDYQARPRTTASITWIPTGWIAETRYLTSDIKEVVQEVIDREGWSSTNDIAFFIFHASGWIGAEERFSAYDRGTGSAKAPILQIEWTEVTLPTITFYNQSNSVFMMNGTKIANGTVTEYINETRLELQGIINVSTQFIEWNITTGNIQVNPYNYTITQDATIWLIVDGVSGGNGGNGGETLFLFGGVNAVPINLLFYIALTTIGLTLLLKAQFLGKILSALLFAFQAIWISGDVLLDTQINYISAYNTTTGVYQYANTITHIGTPILSFLTILSIGLALKSAIDVFREREKRKG